jgi:hypothetical protein
MFRTNNCLSSGGLHKQLAVIYHASLGGAWWLLTRYDITLLVTIYEMPAGCSIAGAFPLFLFL